MTDPRVPPEPAGRGSQNTLFFIVGGLIVLVGIVAYVVFGGKMPGGDQTDIIIEAPSTDSGTDTGTTTGSDTTQ
jgi:hypothetical protein